MKFVAVPAVACTLLLSGPPPVRADRAVGPIDRLTAWTVEVASSLSYVDRTVSVISSDGESIGDGSEVAITPALRVWLTDWLDVALRQPIALDRWLAIDGVSEDVEGSAMHDVELSSSMLVTRGALAGGTSLRLGLPSGGWSFSSERIALTAAGIAAWNVREGGHLFAQPSFTVRKGDFESDAADALGLELGFTQRLGALSLVPRIAVERTLRLIHSGEEVEGSFTTWRAGVEAALEVVPDLTATLRIDWASAGAHQIEEGATGEANEMVMSIGVGYAWDLGGDRAAARRVPDPAAIRLASARIGSRPIGEDRLRELRHLVPRLRLATLDAERAAGGARGEMVVRSTRDAVEVDDRVGAPALARAVADFYRRALPAWAREVDRVEITLCFDRCADASL